MAWKASGIEFLGGPYHLYCRNRYIPMTVCYS